MFSAHLDLEALLPGYRVVGGHSYRENLAVGLPVALRAGRCEALGHWGPGALGHWGTGLDWTALEALGH